MWRPHGTQDPKGQRKQAEGALNEGRLVNAYCKPSPAQSELEYMSFQWEREREHREWRALRVWGLSSDCGGKRPHFNCQPLHFFSRNSASYRVCDPVRFIPTSVARDALVTLPQPAILSPASLVSLEIARPRFCLRKDCSLSRARERGRETARASVGCGILGSFCGALWELWEGYGEVRESKRQRERGSRARWSERRSFWGENRVDWTTHCACEDIGSLLGIVCRRFQKCGGVVVIASGSKRVNSSRVEISRFLFYCGGGMCVQCLMRRWKSFWWDWNSRLRGNAVVRRGVGRCGEGERGRFCWGWRLGCAMWAV